MLGYPASYLRGGYAADEFRGLGVELPPTVDEDLGTKPGVHSLTRMGMNAYLGPLRNRRAQLDYVNFYAHLHRVVDRKLGRLLAALGSADDPGSLRARTMVVRCADHGEMGLSHGGLRQKMFNAYEETINVPLVFSNPALFAAPAETDAFASLIDIGADGAVARRRERLTGDLRGRDLTPVMAARAKPDTELAGRAEVALSPVLEHPAPAQSVQDAIHFTYDDHQAATAMQDAPGQPNRIRAIRTRHAKYAFYFDPNGREQTEYELYDLDRDPLESQNLVGVRTGKPRSAAARKLHSELSERLDEAMNDCNTQPRDG